MRSKMQEKEHWNNTYDGSVSTYIGLPSYGQRYSGNDLNINYWYMNRWVNSSSSVGRINNYGISYGSSVDYLWYGVRPVLVLNSNLIISSGDGTSSSPYQIDL